ncbi:hypothetical protein [Vibrio hippocampi]|uniref:hypothetical protein n=1 Tax=Vibrio hippocampi TaxID=654686 RepID=UPI001F207682|nr:hypothetical protein [Vibrio hippocampi]
MVAFDFKEFDRLIFSSLKVGNFPSEKRYKYGEILVMKLDFDLETNVEHGYLLIPEPAAELAQFPEVYERISSVIYHCVMVSGEATKRCISMSAKNATHIRSALCEFVGVEDLLKQLYPALPKSEYVIYKSTNPTWHMIKILRNYNIHISNSLLSIKPIRVRSLFPNQTELDVEVEYISNLTIDGLKLMHSTNDYNDTQLKNLISSFDHQQHKFGVTTLIIKTAIDYSHYLAKILCSNRLL